MVIVNIEICKELGLFRRFIVFGSERNVRYGRSLEVDIKRELESISCVLLFGVVPVIDIRFYRDGIFRIVFKILFERAEIYIHRRAVNGTAAVHRLALIAYNLTENFSARRVFDNSHRRRADVS